MRPSSSELDIWVKEFHPDKSSPQLRCRGVKELCVDVYMAIDTLDNISEGKREEITSKLMWRAEISVDKILEFFLMKHHP